MTKQENGFKKIMSIVAAALILGIVTAVANTIIDVEKMKVSRESDYKVWNEKYGSIKESLIEIKEDVKWIKRNINRRDR